MESDCPGDITGALTEIRSAGPAAAGPAIDRLVGLVYDRLRRMAGHLVPASGQPTSLQATDLVDETLVNILSGDLLRTAPNRAYFFGAASRAMRCILADRARARNRLKRGGGWQRVPLQDIPTWDARSVLNTVEMHDALEVLARRHPRAGDVITLRVLGGFTAAEVALQLEISVTTVEEDSRFARAWLRKELGSSAQHVR